MDELLKRKSLYIMAIDPGEQTGWVLCRLNLPPHDLEFEVEQLGTQPFEEMLKDMRVWGTIGATVDVFVLETYPSRLSESEQMKRVLRLSQLISDQFMPYSKLFLMSPADWKPIAKAQKWHVDGKTPHEKDAFNILRYYALTEFKVDLGDYYARS